MSRDTCNRFMSVRSIREETPETKSLSLNPTGEPFQFIPGQFVNVTIELPDKRRVRRAYSIASSPLDRELLLTVKRMEPGLVSKYLCDQVKPGDLLDVRGPYGRFTLDETAPDIVFIAGGSGIVPFRSMWRYIHQTGLKTRISLLYASKSLRYVIYRDELAALGEAGCRMAYTFTHNEDALWEGYSRRIDQEMLVDFVKDFTEKAFYVCGPPKFCECVIRDLIDLNVERERIKIEKYD